MEAALGLRRSDNWSSFKGGIVLVLAVLLANGLISYRILRQLVSNNQLVVHTLHVINELDATFSTLKDAENGQRGYLITSDPTYLNRYRQAASEVFAHIDGIGRLTMDNRYQQSQIPTLRELTQQRLAIADQTIELKRLGKPQVAKQ